MKGEMTVTTGSDSWRSRLEWATRVVIELLTSPDPDEAVLGYLVLARSADCTPLFDHLSVRLQQAWRRARGGARDRTLGAIRFVAAMSYAAQCRRDAGGDGRGEAAGPPGRGEAAACLQLAVVGG